GVSVAADDLGPLRYDGFIGLLMCYAWGAIRGRFALDVLFAYVILPVVAFFFNGVTVALGRVAMLGLLMLRRLEGLPHDTRTYGHFWRLAWDRLVFDERPGRPLMGPRTDPGVNAVHK